MSIVTDFIGVGGSGGSGGGKELKMKTFEANGTFVVPTGVTLIRAIVMGGGGGGGIGASSNYKCGSGAGAGGYIDHTFTISPSQAGI